MASPTGGSPIGATNAFINIPDVGNNKEVQEVGKFAVEEYNKGGHNIKFISVVAAERQEDAEGVNYRLWIHGQQANKVDKVYKALVFVPVHGSWELKSFVLDRW